MKNKLLIWIEKIKNIMNIQSTLKKSFKRG